eukprot:Rmarinus@m.11510
MTENENGEKRKPLFAIPSYDDVDQLAVKRRKTSVALNQDVRKKTVEIDHTLSGHVAPVQTQIEANLSSGEPSRPPLPRPRGKTIGQSSSSISTTSSQRNFSSPTALLAGQRPGSPLDSSATHSLTPKIVNRSASPSSSGPLDQVSISSTSSSTFGPVSSSTSSSPRVSPSHEDAVRRSNSLCVSPRQKGNPLLSHLKNVRWMFVEGIQPDYVMSPTSCALFLSLRYHLLNPNYLRNRISRLPRHTPLRVLLCYIDVQDDAKIMQEITKTAIMNNLTLICAWSWGECAKYLETYRACATKPTTILQGRVEDTHAARASAFFKAIRPVNQTDISTLASTFGTVRKIFLSSMHSLQVCPGLGDRKVKRIHAALHEPFRTLSRQTSMDTFMSADTLASDSPKQRSSSGPSLDLAGSYSLGSTGSSETTSADSNAGSDIEKCKGGGSRNQEGQKKVRLGGVRRNVGEQSVKDKTENPNPNHDAAPVTVDVIEISD